MPAMQAKTGHEYFIYDILNFCQIKYYIKCVWNQIYIHLLNQLPRISNKVFNKTN